MTYKRRNRNIVALTQMYIVIILFQLRRACRHLETFGLVTTYRYKCDLLVSFISHTQCGIKLARKCTFVSVGCARVKSF